MGYLFRFAKVHSNEPSPTITMREVIATVDLVIHASMGTTISAAINPSQDHLCKTVLELDTFKGTDEDAFQWMEDTLTKLGAVGLSRYLTEPSLVQKNPDIAKRFF